MKLPLVGGGLLMGLGWVGSVRRRFSCGHRAVAMLNTVPLLLVQQTLSEQTSAAVGLVLLGALSSSGLAGSFSSQV